MIMLSRKAIFFILGLLLCGSLDVCAASNLGPVDMGPFYTSLPSLDPHAKLGQLVKAEKIATTLSGVQAWRIAYVSSDVNDHKTLVTGILAAPSGSAPVKDRPVMAWAHGTTGTAQNCGPSQVLNPAVPLNQYYLANGNSYMDYGLPAMAQFIKAGYVIVATDYQGLGGGGRHQYTVAATQARDVINAIRAAAQVKEAQAGSQAIVYGWSQGGGATLAAASLPDYVNATGTARDGIQLVGFVALAPYDIAVVIPPQKLTEAEAMQRLQGLMTQFSANVSNFTHYAENVWGSAAAFPQLKLEDIFTTQGAKVVNEIMDRKCVHVAADTINYAYGANYKTLMRPDIHHALAWIEAIKSGSVKPIKPMAPVIIYWGTQDTVVPPMMSQLYYQQMCQLGGNLTRIQLPGEQTHISTPAVAEPMYVQWVADRFAGKTAVNGCGKV